MRAGKGRGSAAATKREMLGSIFRTAPTLSVIAPMMILVLIGLIMVFSAGSAIDTTTGKGQEMLFLKQLVGFGIGFGAFIFFSLLDYRALARSSWLLVLLVTFLLIMVFPLGQEAGGATRKIPLWLFSFQPGEVAKIVLVIFTAAILAIKRDALRFPVHLALPIFLVVAFIAGLIYLQPDMGTTLVVLFTVFVMLWTSEAKAAHLSFIMGAGGAIAFLFSISEEYRRNRWLAVLDPFEYSDGSGHQLIQSYVAFSTGNLTGVGLGMSKQKYSYLPNGHTDFIFAIIGEELGLIGALVVLGVYIALVIGGLYIASGARDPLGRYLAYGIASLFLIQAIINIGGVVGLLPITGIPLPFISSGSSSLIICMAAVGILVNVALQGDFEGGRR